MMTTGPEFFLDMLCLALNSTNDTTLKLIQQAMQVYNEERGANGILDDKKIRIYIAIIEEIIKSNLDVTNKAEVDTLLLKFEHSDLLDQNSNIITKLRPIVQSKDNLSPRRIEYLQRQVKNWIIWHHTNFRIRKMFKKNQIYATKTDPMEQNQLVAEIVEHARELIHINDTIMSTETESVDVIDMSDKNSIKKALLNNANSVGNNVLKMGLQGFNRLFGVNGGPVRGEFCAIAALSHHFKSGQLMNIARWIATLNQSKVNFGKKAAIVFISLENEIYKNLNQWFKDLYINMFQKSPDGMTIDDIVDCLHNEFNKHGYTLLVYRKDPDFFGYNEYQTLLQKIMEQGYEVVASIIDYMTLMKLEDADDDNNPKKIQKLGQRLKTFGARHNMLTFTGLQLTGDAEYIATSGQTYIVKRFGANHLSDCKSLIKELDWLAFQHIEHNHNDVPYLTWAWKKHRYNEPPPSSDRFCGYRFGVYGIIDDIHGSDRSILDIYTDAAEPQKNETKTELSLF